jgi:hypothetical protein
MSPTISVKIAGEMDDSMMDFWWSNGMVVNSIAIGAMIVPLSLSINQIEH